MKLPEPARTVWREHRETLHEHARNETPPSRLMLGGGTILAARLGHRQSSDIDVVLPDIDNLGSWEPGGPLDLTRATGGRLVGQRENRIVIRVTDDSSLDVAAIRPKLPGTEIEEEIEGQTETTLSNAQIILGKLYRTERSVTRDAFDIVTVARADPRALEIAVNALKQQDLQVVRANLFASNDRMARNAKNVLHGITPEHETDLRNLGRNASIATNAHRYERVRIRADNGLLTVEKRTRTGSLPKDIHEPETARTGLRQTGIHQYLAANAAISSERALRDLGEIAGSGWTGRVFDSSDARPYTRVIAALNEARASRQGPRRKTDRPESERPRGSNPGDGRRGDAAQAATEEKPELRPPSAGILAGAGANHSGERNVVRNPEAGPGGAGKPRTTAGCDAPEPGDEKPGGFEH